MKSMILLSEQEQAGLRKLRSDFSSAHKYGKKKYKKYKQKRVKMKIKKKWR